MSRKVLIPLTLALLGIFWILWKSTGIPARVAIINQSGYGLTDVAVDGVRIGAMSNGESRMVSLTPSASPVIRFRGRKPRTWRAESALGPGQTLVVYITPGDRIDARGKIGTLTR